MPISRRDFLKTSSLFATYAALAACAPMGRETGSDATPPFGTPVQSDGGLIFDTLRRLTFGPTPGMIERARKMGLSAFIEEQLTPESIPDLEMDSILRGFTTLDMSLSELLQLEKKGQPVQELVGSTILRGLLSQRQLYEVMVDFWSNHFNIYVKKGLCRVLKTADDLHVIRPNALGNFGDLLHASAHSPAMLIYLDQADSEGEIPNENYARELIELHTLGVTSGYTDEDILETARTLTGWSVIGPYNKKNEPGSFAFKPSMHNNEKKTVMGLVIPPGGEEEGNALLDMLAHHPATARSISMKLARRFISDHPDPRLIDSLAQVFSATDGDTRAMIRAMTGSEEFRASAGQKFKRPLEFLLSAVRLMEATIDPNSQNLQEHLRLLGQVPFSWDTPSGYPDFAEHWTTTSGLIERWNFGLQLSMGEIAGVKIDIKSLLKDAASGQDIVDLLSIRFLGAPLPTDARSILLDFIASGDLDKNISSAAGLILGSPHFQIR